MAGLIASGHTVIMRRFGAFHVVETKGRIGRNPKRPEQEIWIPAQSKVKFKPGLDLKTKVASAPHPPAENRPEQGDR